MDVWLLSFAACSFGAYASVGRKLAWMLEFPIRSVLPDLHGLIPFRAYLGFGPIDLVRKRLLFAGGRYL